ncbi:hypothetical protein RM550_02165 [Streptomyces sp. DSM 41527]|uniref:Uncharacterized protein n=1 Tax=Streptomyces mooreae TaxID=3075523 RepID=A0ABU2SZX8_9ACTN|nr:hypothetical protein [Streptomyces sp. DSM 41527]MDT0454542.1 hypothetical protein [Streptomyces sp. DSM 41527]
MRTRSIALSSVAAATALLGVAGTAAADSSTPAPSASASAKTRTGDGAQALCKRAPKIDKRLHRALHRLQGKAGVRGSVARLEKRAEKAKAAGHTEIATFLNHKLAHRKSLIPTLQQRQKDLAKVATWCRSHQNTTSS